MQRQTYTSGEGHVIKEVHENLHLQAKEYQRLQANPEAKRKDGTVLQEPSEDPPSS